MKAGFVQVFENLLSHGIYYFSFQAAKSWNLSEGHEESWESNVLPENRKAKRQKNTDE